MGVGARFRDPRRARRLSTAPVPCPLKVSIHSVWLGNSITPLREEEWDEEEEETELAMDAAGLCEWEPRPPPPPAADSTRRGDSSEQSTCPQGADTSEATRRGSGNKGRCRKLKHGE